MAIKWITHVDVSIKNTTYYSKFSHCKFRRSPIFRPIKTLDCSNNVYDTIHLYVKNIPSLPNLLETFICTSNEIDNVAITSNSENITFVDITY